MNHLASLLRAPELLSMGEVRAVPVGHRGAPRLYPENTLESFVCAVELGAWMIELDVHQAKDGTLVVFHDEELTRMTGADGTVASHSWNELAKLSVEGWWKIPRLDDVIVRLRERCWINVEIKRADPARVAELLRRLKMTDQVIVSSFDWDVIARMKDEAGEVARALLTEERHDVASALAKHGARGWFPRADQVDAAVVAAVHDAGAAVMTWTVDDPAQMRGLAELGVDAICSNDISTLVGVVA